MTKDREACEIATKEYAEVVDKYGLDSIEDGWGQSTKRCMIDAFISGFYSGRDYQRRKNDKDKKI